MPRSKLLLTQKRLVGSKITAEEESKLRRQCWEPNRLTSVHEIPELPSGHAWIPLLLTIIKSGATSAVRLIAIGHLPWTQPINGKDYNINSIRVQYLRGGAHFPASMMVYEYL
jgi:hypothetical protein